MKISNFRFFVRKFFQKFSISNFENGFSSWKNTIFCSGFFSWQDMIILHRKMSPALSLFDLSQERNGQTSTNPWILPSSDAFSREASYGALREKVVALGRFQGILLKFHILKIKFLHEKIIFLVWIFFSWQGMVMNRSKMSSKPTS